MRRDTIHIKAPGCWMNDPNGFIFYKGQYHIFYQCFPYGPRWGRMHWGHAVSEDLVHWNHEGIALFPSKHGDRDGCFSGSAVEYDGKMYLFYTGVRYLAENPEDTNLCADEQFVSAQMMITSEDGIHFDNIRDKMEIIGPLEDESLGDKTHTRDPKVWRGKDAWYMVLGTHGDDLNGKLLFYRSDDLRQWSYVNSVSKDGFGWMWECPDYFVTRGGSVLSFSPMGFLKDGYPEENQNICMVVDFDEETCTMKMADEYQFLDYGLDLYAAQSTVDRDGRRVVTAWARMPDAVDGDWIGMMSSPRVVEVEDGHVYFRVHPAIREAYRRKISTPAEASEAGYRLETDLEDGEAIDIGGYRVFRKGERICTDRSRVAGSGREGQWRMHFETPCLKGGSHVEVLVDSNLIEVFVNDGEYVITNVVYSLGNEIQAVKELALYAAE